MHSVCKLKINFRGRQCVFFPPGKCVVMQVMHPCMRDDSRKCWHINHALSIINHFTCLIKHNNLSIAYNAYNVMHNASVLAHAQRLRVQNSIIQYLNEILV